MSMTVKVSGAWKDVDAVSVKVGGTWKAVEQAYVKAAGVWESLLVTRGDATLIDRTAGTILSDAAYRASASFDGITSQDTNATTAHLAASMYIGKTFSTPAAVESVTAFGSTNEGFKRSETGQITIALFGKTGAAPTSGTDGTQLGSITFTEQVDESAGRTINSSDTSTYWDHVWINISGGGASYIFLAELQITGWQD